MLVGLDFCRGPAGNAESESVLRGEAVGQIQGASPISAGRAWRRELLTFSNRRNCFPAQFIRASGRVVVQRDVPGDMFSMTGLDVGDEAIAWRLGVME